MKKGKRISICVVLLAAMLLSGCGSKTMMDQSNGSAMPGGAGAEAGFDMATNESSKEMDTAGAESVRIGRKLIRTADISVETLEFDKLLDYVKNRTKELGGYIESMDVWNGSAYDNRVYNTSGYRNDRSANLTLRIPSDKMDSFLVSVGDNSNIINQSEQEKDVTLDYVDLDSHKRYCWQSRNVCLP